VLDFSSVQNTVMLVLTVALFGAKVFALVDCLTGSTARFSYVETLPRRTWLILLGLSVAAHAVSWNPLGLLNLAGTVAALVYLAQVRGSVSR
jgi:hypothetical protein